jgi:hypothetical protein
MCVRVHVCVGNDLKKFRHVVGVCLYDDNAAMVRLHKAAGDLFYLQVYINPFTASCENAMTLSVPGVLASCEKFPH